MHYVSLHGRHVEIDLTPRGEYVLAGTLDAPPQMLKPVEVATQYVKLDERRNPLHERRSKGRLPIGRRHRDHTSAAQDCELARKRVMADDAVALRARLSGETRVQDEAA